MSINLWGSATSACTHRVLITPNELGLMYDLTQVNLMKGEHEFGGPSSSLDAIMSGNPVKIGNFEKALSIGNSYFDPSVKIIVAELVNLLEAEKATAMFMAGHDYYEDVLDSDAYLAGNTSLSRSQNFSLADVYVFTWMPYIKLLGLHDEIAARPRLESLWKRISSRSFWKSAVKDMP
ncbi:hypothetical protein BDP55DRAFT_743068 [Colletotrichum godetiae]|uniref:GST C-terminal domain-containing protein n=1 Tax=Colletotrichum godetiae TaxID=1209918 RepID=A0AAJ0AYL8_9PEZI|nr:uncharacterized protein BDP55DRAFT_743068 [Colletotrichum godetiae]KAK1700196.1 hypothetical protein BDP55DRAFT_743068 [Colletotrichum godetiae]